MGIFESLGLKRKIAAILAIIIEIAAVIPELAPIMPILQYIGALFGVTGIVHGTAAKTISKFKLSTLASLLTALAALSLYVPALAPYTDYLQKAAAIIGGIVLGTTDVSKKLEAPVSISAKNK